MVAFNLAACSQALFAWPPQAAVARQVAKSKIYAHAKPNAALRALFALQVDSITWGYKLAPETVNLAASASVPEIEVFEVALKLPDIHPAVLRCIDQAIPFPIVFVLRFEGHSQAVAAYKRPSDAAPSKLTDWVVGDYHAGAWQADSVPRPALPVALDLQRLYELLVRAHVAAPCRAGETLREQLERLAQLQSQQTAAAKLAARLAQEKQFNRKVALNAELRALEQTIASLAR